MKQLEQELEKTKAGLDKEKKRLLKSKVLAAPPPYWDTRLLRLDQPAKVVKDNDLIAEVQKIMTSTCISRHIGIGRDSHGLKHTGFKVVSVQRYLHFVFQSTSLVIISQFYSNFLINLSIPRVENPLLWSKYQLEREAIRANLPRSGASLTKVDCFSRSLWKQLQIQAGANEVLMWHGTKAGLWDVITKQGLDERLASNGLFGHGIYFAENSSKSDEYIVPDRNGLCYIFLARVCLGEPHSTLQSTRGMKRPPARTDNPNILYDSVRGECQQHKPFGKPNAFLKRYREFIVFDRKQTYPELLITFKRV